MLRVISLIALVSILPTSAAAQYFNGYPCTQDCSGHRAGYNWAERNDINDESDCWNRSNSFEEGCLSYLEEQEEEEETEAEEGSYWNSDDEDY